MFPTTVWTTIGRAGADDRQALQEFADRYRPPILRFLQGRGFPAHDAEDLCQEVFLRVLRGGVLAKADPHRGRFRSLMLAVTTHVILDRARRRRETPMAEPPVVTEEPDFDRAWATHLIERALSRLHDEGSPYHDVLAGHVRGERQNRNKLWIARRKLAAALRREVALTCASREESEQELAYLSRFMGPSHADGDG